MPHQRGDREDSSLEQILRPPQGESEDGVKEETRSLLVTQRGEGKQQTCRQMYRYLQVQLRRMPEGDWNISSVTDLTFRFYFAASFNQPLADWNLSSGTTMVL
jgi:hypothetical protein